MRISTTSHAVHTAHKAAKRPARPSAPDPQVGSDEQSAKFFGAGPINGSKAAKTPVVAATPTTPRPPRFGNEGMNTPLPAYLNLAGNAHGEGMGTSQGRTALPSARGFGSGAGWALASTLVAQG